jgi:hypothetical protein
MITTPNRIQAQAPARTPIIRSSTQSRADTRPRIIRNSTQPQADARTPVTAPTRIHERTP